MVCTCAAELTNDSFDGALSQETSEQISSAAAAVGLGAGFQSLSWGTLDAFADALNLGGAGGKVVTGMANGAGVIGVVNNGASLFIAIREDGLDWGTDWGEAVGFAAALVGVVGMVVSLPATVVVGATVIGIGAGIAGYYQGSELSGNVSTPVDSSCPVHH